VGNGGDLTKLKTVATAQTKHADPGVVRRQDVAQLSRRQLSRLRAGYARMMQLDGSAGYSYWASVHGLPFPINADNAHGTDYFLPWHRAYVYLFERALRDQDPGLSVPWWNWIADSRSPLAIPPAFAEPEWDGGPNPLYSSTILAEALEQGGRSDGPSRTERQPGAVGAPPLPTLADVEDVLGETDFFSFSRRLESINNSVHVWVGGDMGQAVYYSYDPLSWAHMAMIDRLWCIWQSRHPAAELPREFLDSPLQPFDLTVEQVLDSRALGYEYASDVLAVAQALVGPAQAAFSSDLIGQGQQVDDLLTLEPEVDALAGLLVHKDVHPPLAVGLFGDWGTGKSYFMRLLDQRIAVLAAASHEVDEGETDFCADVRQIWFNAWHYADANLWASLLAELFDKLAGVGDVHEVTEGLESTKEPREAVELRIHAAVAEREEAEREAERLRRLSSTSAARKVLANPAEWAELADDPAIRTAAKRLENIDSAAAEQADRLLDATGVAARLSVGGRWVVRYLRQHWALAVVALVGLALLTLGALTLGDRLGPAAAAVGGVVTLLAGLARPVQQLDLAAKSLTDVRTRVEARAKAQKLHAEKRLDDALAEEAAARRQRDKLATSAGLREFLTERAGSDDYRSQLGLVSLVRRDLERLSRTLQRAQGTPRGAGRIDRVILYIDDLDRCAAPRVVEVLEAVHLLLAFELFVVVVGVDSRWLLSSLQARFAPQLGVDRGLAQTGEFGTGSSWVTTPQNYLEKIFQIPFAIPPMGAEGYEQLVGELMAADVAQEHPSALVAIEDAPLHDPGVVDGESPSAAVTATPGSRVELGSAVHPTLRPPGLQIRPTEVSYLASLSSLIGTPRSAKRLVNLYRLLRSSLDPQELQAFIGVEDQGDYRTVGILLALLTGAPGVAPRIFSALLAEAPDEGWVNFLERLKTADCWDPQHLSEARRFVAALTQIAARDDMQQTVADFQQWVPRVGRYSFETSRLMPEALA
jgi:hypothetical protein